MNNTGFYKPRTLSQWILLLAITGIVMSTLSGQRRLLRILKEDITQRLKNVERPVSSHNLSQSIYYLKKRNLIKIIKSGNTIKIVLTDKGRRRELGYKWNNMRILAPASWDHKWRFVMFDIPQMHDNKRKLFRDKLKMLGFVQFQKSIWVYPYSCEDEIDFITEYLSIARYITMLTVSIEDDSPLRKKFDI